MPDMTAQERARHIVVITVTYMDDKEERFVVGEDGYYTWLPTDKGLMFKTHQIVDRMVIPWGNIRRYEVKRHPTRTELRQPQEGYTDVAKHPAPRLVKGDRTRVMAGIDLNGWPSGLERDGIVDEYEGVLLVVVDHKDLPGGGGVNG